MPLPNPSAETVSLREVTRETLRPILQLQVRPEQARFVASNAVSIAQAHFEPRAWFRAIYAGETPVGFAMLEVTPGSEKVYLWRFMIAAEHQGRGYGRRALELLLAHARTLPGCREMQLSYVAGEGSPAGFYRGIGFAETGEVDPDGELFMRRPL